MTKTKTKTDEQGRELWTVSCYGSAFPKRTVAIDAPGTREAAIAEYKRALGIDKLPGAATAKPVEA